MFKTLKKVKFFYTYLIGAIEKDTKDGGQTWRNDITPALDKAGIYTQDPCLTEPLVTGMNVIEAQDKFNKWIISGNYGKFAENFKKVVEKDIRMVHRSDFVIVHLFENIPTTGSIHEMAEAWRLKKKIYLIWREAKNKISKWALFLTTDSGGRVFDNPKQLTDFIALVYDKERQSLRIQIIQFIKGIIRLIGEGFYAKKLIKIKAGLPKVTEIIEDSKEQKEKEK